MAKVITVQYDAAGSRKRTAQSQIHKLRQAVKELSDQYVFESPEYQTEYDRLHAEIAKWMEYGGIGKRITESR